MSLPADDIGAFQGRSQTGALTRILDSVLDAGRAILRRERHLSDTVGEPPETLARLCQQLVRHRGEASGLALAEKTLTSYESLTPNERHLFFDLLVRDFSIDPEKAGEAARKFLADPDVEGIAELRKATESPCKRLFRRLNMIPGGTSALVRMRGDMLEQVLHQPAVSGVESELRQLLIAWFNRGFLRLERIDWDSPARILEKIIKYEAVHEINGWGDLKNRLKQDRRLFAFFHPAMPFDPLIFVEIALGQGHASAIRPLIGSNREVVEAASTDTATFYSISNCHRGLQGISFGNFLIKQVAAELRIELPHLRRFETLSPVPGFRRWLTEILDDKAKGRMPVDYSKDIIAALSLVEGDMNIGELEESDVYMKLCAHYLLNEKRGAQPADAVARFHLGNGAVLDRVHWAADDSNAGHSRSFGIMVNYLYEPREIENRHEDYFARSLIAASPNVRKLARF